MSELTAEKDKGLNPEMKERLLSEARHPLRGLRKVLWLTLFGSAVIGLLVMLLRAVTGETVLIQDAFIQVFALIIFGVLSFIDRSPFKKNE